MRAVNSLFLAPVELVNLLIAISQNVPVSAMPPLGVDCCPGVQLLLFFRAELIQIKCLFCRWSMQILQQHRCNL